MFDNEKIQSEQHDNQNNEVIILSDGGHADILFPIKNHIYDWNDFLGDKNYNISSYLSIGWGDYRHRLICYPYLWFETSFLNVKILSTEKVEKKKKIIRLKINRQQYIRLVNNIQKDFKDTQPIQLRQNDFLFKAYGEYYIIENNSNNWVNKHLLNIGLGGYKQVVRPQAIFDFHSKQA